MSWEWEDFWPPEGAYFNDFLGGLMDFLCAADSDRSCVSIMPMLGFFTSIRGQPSIYFPIGDHVNVSWCCSHTNASGVISTSHIVASHITKLLLSFRQILQFRFLDNPQGRIPPWKVTKTRPFLSMCYGDPSATEVPPCCETATNKLTFSTTSVLLLLNMPLSLSRATIFRRQKNPRRVYRPKIAGILFVCNEPEGKYYTVPIPSTRSRRSDSARGVTSSSSSNASSSLPVTWLHGESGRA